jgi:nucleotide-binding universal stress UspA family protein
MNYLVPLDFSEQSKTAAEYAAALSKVWPGNLHLLHVIERTEEEQAYIPVKTLNVKKNTVFEMFQFQESLRRKFNVRTGADLISGIFTSKVLKTALREKSDLIVIGTQGSSGLRDHLYGSKTMSLIGGSNLPVLAVPADTGLKQFRHIVYVTEYHRSEIESIVSLGKIASKFKAVLSVVSFSSTESESAMNEFRDGIKERIPFAAVHFEDRMHDGTPAEALQEFSLTASVDLIGVSTSQADLVNSITGADLGSEFQFMVDVPVLFFPG